MYIRDKNPAGKLPGVGWGPNMRALGSYRPSANPSSRKPGDLRGLGCSGNCSGCTKKLGCARLGGLGQDDQSGLFNSVDASEGYTAPTTSYTQDQLAAMWAQPDTPLTLNPATGIPYGTSATAAGAGYGGQLNTAATLQLAGAPLGLNQPASTTSWLWIVAGISALGLVVSLGSKRR